MKITIRIAVLFFALMRAASLFAETSQLPSAETASKEKLLSSYGRLPLSFEENRGQADPSVAFLSRGPGYTLFLTQTEAALMLRSGSKERSRNRKTPDLKKPEQAIVRMRLVGANPKAVMAGEDPLRGTINYVIGNDPAKWQTAVPGYAKVKYKEVYRGIDLLYYGNQRQLEYDFVVSPGADPKLIGLTFSGANQIRVDSNGDLILALNQTEFRFRKPIVYQELNGNKKLVPGDYRLDKDKVGFKIAEYDKTRPLIIDPVFGYSTFLGGSGDEFGKSITVDSSGAAYITGFTASANFPITPDSHEETKRGDSDIFVTKLNQAGTAFIFSTYLGGNLSDIATGIALDSSGAIYLAANTQSSDFPATTGSPQPGAYIVKLNPSGNAILYSASIGPGAIMGLAVDPAGRAYGTGYTDAPAFRTSPNAFQFAPAGGIDAFVAKVNSAGSGLVYSTLVGGKGNDSGSSIAIDSLGNAYITGTTDSQTFPTKNAIQPDLPTGDCGEIYAERPCGSAFVTKLNPEGTALIYSTFLGAPNGAGIGTGGSGIAIDSSRNAYIFGTTDSNLFPTTKNAFQKINNGITRATFVTKINAAGNAFVYSTYLGGSQFGGSSYSRAIAVDGAGVAYVTGQTDSESFPTTPGALQKSCNLDSRGACSDVFVSKLSEEGDSLIYSTYLGGSNYDESAGIAADRFGDVFVTGATTSSDFPTLHPVQALFGGGSGSPDSGDAFVTKLAFSFSHSDPFNRANSISLGSGWNEYLGGLEINGNAIRNTAISSQAAVLTTALGPDQAVSVDCKVMEAGSSCGVMARWSSENNFYRVRLDAGAQNIALFKTVNGATTKLGQISRPLSFDTFYRVSLTTHGSKISVSFANESAPAIAVTDTSLPSGNFAGIRSYAPLVHSTLFDNFDVTTPLADTFNRANSTSLGANWDEYLSDLELFDGEVRNVNGGGQSKAARYDVSVGPDQEVAADCKVTAIGNSCGVMARWSDSNNFYHLRLDAGAQNVALFKTVNGITTKLGQFNRPLKLNTYYRLRLRVKRNSLSAVFGNEAGAALSVNDPALVSGSYAGIRAYATVADATYFNNFDLSVAP